MTILYINNKRQENIAKNEKETLCINVDVEVHQTQNPLRSARAIPQIVVLTKVVRLSTQGYTWLFGQ